MCVYACVCAYICEPLNTRDTVVTVAPVMRRRPVADRIVIMAERDIVAKIRNYLKTVPRCFFWKEHGGKYGTAGIPDIVACIDGHFFGFEVKTEKGKPTVLQEATIRKILKSGGTAAVVRSVDEVRALIEGTLQRDKDTP